MHFLNYKQDSHIQSQQYYSALLVRLRLKTRLPLPKTTFCTFIDKNGEYDSSLLFSK